MIISLKNIGPHLYKELHLNSKTNLIFSQNGTGKTFIGKSLQAIKEHDDIEFLKSLVTIGEKESVINIKYENEEIFLCLNHKGESTKLGDFSYPIHVFNDKYTQENLRVFGFKPNDLIEGIILGKGNIDLQTEKDKLDLLNSEIEGIRDDIIKHINTKKWTLKNYDISNSLTAFKDISFQSIEKMSGPPKLSSEFDDLTKEYYRIRNTPEVSISIPYLIFDFEEVIIVNLRNHLKTSYERSFFAEEFKQKFKEKKEFIRFGLSLNESNCPFCEQKYSQESFDLLDKYNKYIDNRENIIIAELSSITDKLGDLERKLIDTNEEQYKRVCDLANIVNESLTRSKQVELVKLPSIDKILRILDQLKQLINEKIENVENKFADVDLLAETLIKEIVHQQNAIKQINHQIAAINTAANNNAKEKLNLKREICMSYKEILYSQFYTKFQMIRMLESDYFRLKEEILKKEVSVKASKREMVAETFSLLLKNFFNGKYEFNSTTFSLYFAGNQLDDKAQNVLSDGEKKVIALIFFLSNIHTVVKGTSEYAKTIIVIDDPTSNLDSENIKKISELIMNMSEVLDLEKNAKTLILTHSDLLIKVLLEYGNPKLLTL